MYAEDKAKDFIYNPRQSHMIQLFSMKASFVLLGYTLSGLKNLTWSKIDFGLIILNPKPIIDDYLLYQTYHKICMTPHDYLLDQTYHKIHITSHDYLLDQTYHKMYITPMIIMANLLSHLILII